MGLSPNSCTTLGKAFRAGVIPCDHKAVYWFFTWTPTSQEMELVKNPIKMKQLMLSRVDKMPSDIKSLIEKTETKDILTSPLKQRHPWELMWGNISKDNVCVVGDAFHPMAPDLGQGGCCALEDGVVLARCVAEAFSKKSDKHVKEMSEKVKVEEQYKNIETGLKKYGDLKLVAHFRDKVLNDFLAKLMLKKSDFDCGKLNNFI
ncbi:Monooxygenase 2, partial [Mucuna pruriens]